MTQAVTGTLWYYLEQIAKVWKEVYNFKKEKAGEDKC